MHKRAHVLSTGLQYPLVLPRIEFEKLQKNYKIEEKSVKISKKRMSSTRIPKSRDISLLALVVILVSFALAAEALSPVNDIVLKDYEERERLKDEVTKEVNIAKAFEKALS